MKNKLEGSFALVQSEDSFVDFNKSNSNPTEGSYIAFCKLGAIALKSLQIMRKPVLLLLIQV